MRGYETYCNLKYPGDFTKTMLPMRKSVPRASRQLDHTKTSWPSLRDANCSGMVMFPVQRCSPYSHPTLMGDNEEMFTLQSPYLDGWWWRDVHPTVTLPLFVMMKRCSPYSYPTLMGDDEEMLTLQSSYLGGWWWRDVVRWPSLGSAAVPATVNSYKQFSSTGTSEITWAGVLHYMSWCAKLHEQLNYISWCAKLHMLVC